MNDQTIELIKSIDEMVIDMDHDNIHGRPTGEDIIDLLEDAAAGLSDLLAERHTLLEALQQILGWRELRSGDEVPIGRIEDLARAAIEAAKRQEVNNE